MFLKLSVTSLSEAKHCPVTSDCRMLITKTASQCHKQVVGKFFDEDYPSSVDRCVCCYVCIKSHAEEGCSSCKEFLETFFPPANSFKLSKSVSSELRFALLELFEAMSVKQVKVENDLALSITSFVADFIKVIDEVKNASDIVHIWHVSSDVASKVFSTLNDVLYGEELYDSAGSSTDEYEDVSDEDSESTDDDIDRLTSLEIFDDN